MRILFIAMTESIHTARWVKQLQPLGWDIHVFDAMYTGLIPELSGVTAHAFYRHLPYEPLRKTAIAKYIERFPIFVELIRRIYPAIWQRFFPSRVETLTRLIRSLKPDIIHSLEMQNESYPLLEVRKRLGEKFDMPWIYSSWGSDLYLFGKQPEHELRIREVLEFCDYYIADCWRDVEAVKNYGYKGEILGVVPAVGGFDIVNMRKLMQTGSTSTRRVVALKGFQSWAGRALVALEALKLCADVLEPYTVVVYGAQDGVPQAAADASKATGIKIEVLNRVPHNNILKLLGSARIAIGVNISDGTPISMLEAMIMGALPIQSDTISTAEWIDDGKNGLLVPPEDPDKIAIAIRKSLLEDDLVDRAAIINGRMMLERVDQSVIMPMVISMYEKVASNKRIK